MVDLSQIRVYRMTHIENIPHILEYGITAAHSINRNPNFHTIGDNNIINKRNQKTVFDNKKLGDYIPFYFGVKMPMLYVIQHQYNNVKALQPEDIVYCVSSLEKIVHSNLSFVFTNGHAFSELSSFYATNEVNNIHNLLDFNAIKAKFWNNDDDLDLKRRKEAELLVENDLPLTIISGYVVYNEQAKTKLETWGIPNHQIAIRPQYYF